MKLTPYDYQRLEKLLAHQQANNWDLEQNIQWSRGLDLSKPFVPLDELAFSFPEATPPERLALSHFMGLMIAVSIIELEECLLRLKPLCWTQIIDKYPVGPEFRALGEQFFAEEQKHSEAFSRYIDLYCVQAGCDRADLLRLLPRVEQTLTEKILRKSLEKDSKAFWWIVALVEQEFLEIYFRLRPFAQVIDPLTFELHFRHYEEEAKHAPFPYLFIQLLDERLVNPVHKLDLAFAQGVQGLWASASLLKVRQLKNWKNPPEDIAILQPLFKKMGPQKTVHAFWRAMTSMPYISTLLNPLAHRKLNEFATKVGHVTLPFFDCQPTKLVKH